MTVEATAEAVEHDAAAAEWRRRRSELTHDWIRNRFLPRLHALRAIGRGEAHADEPMRDQLVATVEEWGTRSGDVLRLVSDYEAMLSPSRIVDGWLLAPALAAPLRCTALQSWRRRHRVPELLEDVLTTHAAAQSSYQSWACSGPARGGAAAGLSALASHTEAFLAALLRLPSNVRL